MEHSKRRKNSTVHPCEETKDSLLFNVFNYDIGMMNENHELRQTSTSFCQSNRDLSSHFKRFVEREYSMLGNEVGSDQNHTLNPTTSNYMFERSSATTQADVLPNCDRRKTQSILSNVWDFDLEMMIENFDPKPNTKSLWQSQPKTQYEFKRKKKRTPLSPLTTNITLAGDGNGSSSQQFSPQTPMPLAYYKSTANRISHSAEKTKKMNISTNGRPRRSTCFSPNTPSINEESEYTGQNNTMPFSSRTHFSPNVPFPQHQPKSNISQCYNSNNGRVRNNGKEKSKVFDLPNTMPLQILDFNKKQKQTSQNDNYYDLEIYGFQDLDNETTDSDEEVDDQLEDCGHDRSTVEIRGKKRRTESGEQLYEPEDEIQSFFYGRCICGCEAAYRIFGFNIHYGSFSVLRLSFHLPGNKYCTFRSNEALPKVAVRETQKDSQLEAYFILNQNDVNARQYLFDEIPQYYVWNDSDNIWNLRKRGKQNGRMAYAHHSSEELWYLRLLLTKVRGATSFECLRTVNGHLC
ncbi:hypothetical protein POM88_023597 [Heracleum sosnowskyi]|uniref:Uncharacterized protein n=1 Tax=Heracleum sosnowskyi TaxID=360622 RepID=A0AAD8MV48_9APIA|nr:hypothetical protein POM88_023597 [Heracleum sosnowskyi]